MLRGEPAAGWPLKLGACIGPNDVHESVWESIEEPAQQPAKAKKIAVIAASGPSKTSDEGADDDEGKVITKSNSRSNRRSQQSLDGATSPPMSPVAEEASERPMSPDDSEVKSPKKKKKDKKSRDSADVSDVIVSEPAATGSVRSPSEKKKPHNRSIEKKDAPKLGVATPGGFFIWSPVITKLRSEGMYL